VRQLCFQCLKPVFNRLVKNDVENRRVTELTTLECTSFHSLHWIGCEYELFVNFCPSCSTGFAGSSNDGAQNRSFAMKIRIDKLLVDRGLVSSRQRAQAMLLAGRVLVNGQKLEKAGTNVEGDAEIRLLGEELKYVSRGGLKLEAALEQWSIDLRNKTCLDVGTSTGGFTDCMLQHGAAEVIAVDTGYGQIAARLREDQRVKLLENTNARYLTRAQLEGAGAQLPVAFIAIDVSFISVTLILPAVLQSAYREPASSTRSLVVLIKPQFEVGRQRVGKGGIVRDGQARQDAVRKVRNAVEALGGRKLEIIDSPIQGAEGNREFLLHAEL
jgi:23S rRNA (cytidine1920-2'-O)/16S rRNA (cytidine1409-2'-O)-methyltransferase